MNPQSDSFLGTWELDPATLDYQHGRPGRRAIYKIEPAAEGLTFILDADDADGKQLNVTYGGPLVHKQRNNALASIRRLAILILVDATWCAAAFCQCTPALEATTVWGGNTHVIMKEPKPTRNIDGVVQDEVGQPLSSVLVEVYDNPEMVLKHPGPDVSGQHRVAACRTNSSGAFTLDVPPGHYELRLSKSAEWNVTSIPVTVRKSARRSKSGIVVRLSAGK